VTRRGLVSTARLELYPIPADAAGALPDDREAAASSLGAHLSDDWPQPPVFPILQRQAVLSAEQAPFGIWIVVERGAEMVIGDIGFLAPPDELGVLEMGYSIVPSHRLRGFASEAATALALWAHRQPQVSRLIARCEPDNVSSIRTLEHAGFERVGTVQDEILWQYAG
jgi:RimJ/RimL family protein N-acetyltransferase